VTLTQSQEVVEFNFQRFRKDHFPALSTGHAFMQYATSLALGEYQLSESDIQAGVMEGRYDGGIDGFHIIVNKTEAVSLTTRGLSSAGAPARMPKQVPFDVVVVQSKSSRDGLDSLAIPKLHEALDLILSGAPRSTLAAYPLHDRLISQIETFRRYRTKLISLDPVRTFTVYVMQPVAEGKITADAKRGARALEAMIGGHLGASTKVKVELLGADGIEKLRTTARDIEGVLKFSKQPLAQSHGKSEAWLGLVTIKDLLDFVQRGKTKVLRDELFTTNVRDFAGASTINSAIRKSLSTDTAAAFWWMNNGITVIVDKATYQSDNAYLLTNPQIVNGLQTSHVIHEAFRENAITAKRRREAILIRVISELNPTVREAIIQGTNNQAPVTSIQLYANDTLQLEIETFLETKGWFYERRRWQYRARKVPRSKVRSILDLAQAVIAGLLLDPDTARARPRDRLEKPSDYERVFAKATPLAVYAKLLDAQAEIETYLRTEIAKSISDDATNDRFYMLTAVVLRLAGVQNASDLSPAVVARSLKTPTQAMLSDIHGRLVRVAGPHADQQMRDKLFKGSSLKSAWIADILSWNSATTHGL